MKTRIAGIVSLLLTAVLTAACSQTAPAVSPGDGSKDEFVVRVIKPPLRAESLAKLIHDATGVQTAVETSSNTLFLKGDSAVLSQAAGLLDQLEKEASDPWADIVFIYPLKKLKAVEVAALLELSFSKNMLRDTEKEPTAMHATADVRTNEVVIYTPQKYVTVIKQIIDEWETGDDEKQLTIKVVDPATQP